MKKPSRTVLIAACTVAIALLSFVFIRNFIDFPVYYAAGRSLLGGRTDLYAPDFALGRVMDYRYPPFFLIALTPLWLVPYPVAAYIWCLLSGLEIAGCVLIVSRTFPALRRSTKMWALVAIATGQYFVMALHYGNAHLLATFLLFASFYCFGLRKDVGAGLLMALAITIKLTPILLLPYFVLKRRWKLLSAVCVFLIALNLSPSAYFGFRANNELLASWYGHVVASQGFHEDNGPINLSLKGQLRRYLSPVAYSQRIDGDVQYPAINVASLSRQQVEGIWAALAVSLFGGVLFMMWRRARGSRTNVEEYYVDRSGQWAQGAQGLSLMLCFMLLVGPLTSKIYFIALLWPAACLASLACESEAREEKIAMRVMIVLAVVNLVLPLLPGRSVQRLFLVLGVDFYVNCLLLAALIVVLVSRQRALRKRSGEPRKQDQSEAKTPSPLRRLQN